MGKEDEIREELSKGIPAKTLVERGYAKSTVYKVRRRMNQGMEKSAHSQFSAENIEWSNKDFRFLPGDSGSVRFDIKNHSNLDLYISQTGIQFEWMDENWIVSSCRNLLQPGVKQSFEIGFTIPTDQKIRLGEHSVRFGVEGMFIDPMNERNHYSQNIMWTEPTFVKIQYPRSGYSLFLSHSTENMLQIRQMEMYLENLGVDVIIGEDKKDPGRVLETKFKELIQQTDIFVGFLTKEAINSDWVIMETHYALEINKPNILLVEEGVDFSTDIQYVKFFRDEEPTELSERIIEHIKLEQPNGMPTELANLLLAGAFGIGIGLLLGRFLPGPPRP